MAEQQRIKKKSPARKPPVQQAEKPAGVNQTAAEQEGLQGDLYAAKARRAGGGDVPPLSLESLMASRGLQPKLRVTAANDRYEQEADAVASQVVERLQAPPAPPKQAQRQQEEEEALQAKPLAATISRVQRQEVPEEEELQAKRIGREGGELDAGTAQSLEAARGGGQQMPGNVRSPMEQAFGADFGGVRIHTGSQAHQLNRAISAKAFTTGNDIFFRQGAYEPHNRPGQELLAHELAHVVQQGNAVQRDDEDENPPPVPPPMPKQPGGDDDVMELPPAPSGRSRSNAIVGPRPVLDGGERDSDEETDSVEGSATATRAFQLQELSYEGFAFFLKHTLGLNDPTAVASLGISFTFNIGISAGIKKILGASVTPFITLGGTINVADDRRLRVGGTLSFGAESELNFFQLWKVHAKIGMDLSIGAAFEDEKHFAAFLISRIAKLLKGFKRVIFGRARDRKKQLTAEEIRSIQQIGLPGETEGYEELSQKGASVTANSVGLSSEVGTSLLGVSASVGASEKRSSFFKDNAEGKRVKKVGHTTAFTFNLELPGLPFSVGVTRTIITHDANPDNDGDYLNIKLSPTISIDAPILQQALLNAPTIFSGSDFEDGCKRFVHAFIDPANIMALAKLNGPASPALEFNMVSRANPSEGKSFGDQVNDGDYFLQYARLTKNFSLTLLDLEQEIPTGVPGLNVDLKESLSLSRTVGAYERLGSRTLTYIQTVYNGLLNRGRRGQGQWEAYRDQHKPEIYDMFIAVADPTSAASAEARGLDTSAIADKLDSSILSKANGFVSKCETFFNPENMRKYDLTQREDKFRLKSLQENVMPSFEAYLEAARQAGKVESAGTWRLVRSGSVTAKVPRSERPFQPELELVKIDKGGGIPEFGFPHNLRESYEEGFRHHVTFVGNHSSGKQIAIKVNFQKPDEPSEKFLGKVYSKGLHKFTKFPMGLTILDADFYDHAQKVERQFRSRYESRVQNGMNFQKAIKEGKKERQEEWEKGLYKHLAEVMTATLDNDLKRQS